jgi:aspartate aminotransferase
VVSPADLERIVRLAHERGIWLLLDECYVYLQYTGALVSGGSFTDAKEHVVVLGSLSKTYAMTGWRAGFALATEAGDRGDVEAAEPVDVEHGVVCAEGGDCGAAGFAGLRAGDARRITLKLRDEALTGLARRFRG